MRTILLSIAFSILFVCAQAQTLHHIEAGGGPGSVDPYYAPQFITINVGDTVRWTNSGGTHNVDGSLATFPTNPEGFRNGNPSSTLWTFERVFTIEGEYKFECEAFDHSLTQFGTITVQGSTRAKDIAQIEWEVFPNPTSGNIRIRSDYPINQASLYSLDGKKIADLIVAPGKSHYQVQLPTTTSGVYLLECDIDGTIVHQRIIIQ